MCIYIFHLCNHLRMVMWSFLETTNIIVLKLWAKILDGVLQTQIYTCWWFYFMCFFLLLSDAKKTWWPAPTSPQSSVRVFYRLPTRPRCPKCDSSSEFSSFAPSLRILTYSVITLSLTLGFNSVCLSATLILTVFASGVIPKAVMDSMEVLTNLHFLKDAKRGHRKRHSLKGNIRNTWQRASCVLFKFTFSNSYSNTLCEDDALDSGEVKGQTWSPRAKPRVHLRRQSPAQEEPRSGEFTQRPAVQDLWAVCR